MFKDFLKSLYCEIYSLHSIFFIRKVGKSPLISFYAKIRGGNRLFIGDNVIIEQFVLISNNKKSGIIKIGSNCEIKRFACLDSANGIIEIGNFSSINSFCQLNGAGGLKIGSEVRIASHTVILSSSHIIEDANNSIYRQGIELKMTTIHNDVWIGSHCVILGGITIGEHSIIAAGSVVNKDVAPYSIVGGVPQKLIRMRK
jgi:acetyltransferase-like isoleucine patch superfamily enzyme